MKIRLNNRAWEWVGLFGAGLIELIFATSRLEIVGLSKVWPMMRRRCFIAAIWHSRILAYSYLYKGCKASIMVSASEDGEIIARILERQGFSTVRGSTTRQGTRALATLIRRVREGDPAVIIPDGPQGPRFQIQPGIVALSQKTGVPIIPMTYSAKHATIFNSWDRFMLPRPFTTYRMVYGEPVHVPADADAATFERCRSDLERDLNRITREADAAFGVKCD